MIAPQHKKIASISYVVNVTKLLGENLVFCQINIVGELISNVEFLFAYIHNIISLTVLYDKKLLPTLDSDTDESTTHRGLVTWRLDRKNPVN